MALIFIAYPLAIYLSLCLLPKSRSSIGIILAAAALGLVWIMNDSAGDGGFSRLLVTLGAVPVAFAALAQGLRRLIPDDAAGWVWPALAGGVGLSAIALFFMLL